MKRIWPILIIAIIVCGIILFFQISKARKISVDYAGLPLIEEQAVEIPIDPLDPIYGNQGAPITITEFVDFNSASSRKTHNTLVAFAEANPEKVRVIFKDFPATGLFSADNIRPHRAAFCALKQSKDKFFIFADALTQAKNSQKTDSELGKIADLAKLNITVWQTCLDATESKTRIEAAISLAKFLGLKKAPGIFINNRKINYLSDINLDDLLEELIKEY